MQYREILFKVACMLLVVDRFVYVSGQIGLNPASGTLDLADNVVDQAEQAFKNTIALLQAAGSSPSLVCKMNVFVNDRSHLVSGPIVGTNKHECIEWPCYSPGQAAQSQGIHHIVCSILQQAAVQQVYLKYIGVHAPCRSDIVVRKLPLGALIEVESFAVKEGCRRLQVAANAEHGVSKAIIGGQKVFASSTLITEGDSSVQAGW